jgi:uncharacterized heparinase superfamily protein
MNPIAKALRLWNTVRWLKPVQVYGRVRYRLAEPQPDLRPAPRLRPATGPWVAPARREQSLVSPTRMRFLNDERDLDAHGWDDRKLAKLWRYNQHYFDDLCAFGAADRAEWHRALIARWIRECRPGKGTAWEPYPTSLRIVNWIKWLRAGNEPVPGMLDSLAAQARFLVKRLEWHLLGNHLFVNAKALMFAGLYFDGDEAEEWFELGEGILREQIPEQILADGGQFERSPMYHALALEDMLDLLNASRSYPVECDDDDLEHLRERLPAMRAFLGAVCHPDGEVAFFNDSVTGVAPTPAELEAYAVRLGLPPIDGGAGDGLPRARLLASNGFARLEAGDAVAILDVGEVGPDYLPGHAHADTLSFELSIRGRRVLVNSGVSQYGVGPERSRQRGTAAHNTLSIGGADSSEVWGGFRVARRARVTEVAAEASGGACRACGTHDGYLRLRGGAHHTREWILAADGGLSVTDTAETTLPAESHWHFAPGFELSIGGDPAVLKATDGAFTVELRAQGAEWRLSQSTYSPRFGLSLPNAKASARLAGPKATIHIEWSPCTSSS